jgi:hypothetical protein
MCRAILSGGHRSAVDCFRFCLRGSICVDSIAPKFVSSNRHAFENFNFVCTNSIINMMSRTNQYDVQNKSKFRTEQFEIDTTVTSALPYLQCICRLF